MGSGLEKKHHKYKMGREKDGAFIEERKTDVGQVRRPIRA